MDTSAARLVAGAGLAASERGYVLPIRRGATPPSDEPFTWLAKEVDTHSPKLANGIELLRAWSANYREYGPYRLRKVENTTPYLYRAIGMAQANDGTWWEILVAVSTEKPNKLIEIRLDRLSPDK